MSSKPLFVLVCSESHEKIQMAAMTASVAAVLERPVHVLISMGAVYAFRKNLPVDQRYNGGRFSQVMKEKNAPDAVELFGQGKMLGEMTMHACSMALDILGWEEHELDQDLFDGAMGLTQFLSDAEEGQFITF
jgi:peroxiredoxin family protein